MEQHTQIASSKTWHQIYTEARERLIRRATVSIDDIVPGLYLLLDKDQESEVEPRTIIIDHPGIHAPQLQYFLDFHFVKL